MNNLIVYKLKLPWKRIFVYIVLQQGNNDNSTFVQKWDVSVAKPLGLSESQKNWCTHGNYIFVELYNIIYALILGVYD